MRLGTRLVLAGVAVTTLAIVQLTAGPSLRSDGRERETREHVAHRACLAGARRHR